MNGVKSVGRIARRLHWLLPRCRPVSEQMPGVLILTVCMLAPAVAATREIQSTAPVPSLAAAAPTSPAWTGAPPGAPAPATPSLKPQAQAAPLGRAVETQAKPAPTPGPRFRSLRSNEVYLRAGPGMEYPIEWKYLRRRLPVEIIQNYENWRKVRDWQGTEGWTHNTNLADERTVLVVGGQERLMRDKPTDRGTVIARAEPGVIFRFLRCRGPWCEVDGEDRRGWIRRAEVWGIAAEEGQEE